MAYICKHFKIQELVPKNVYADRGDKAWQLFDDKILITIDDIKEVFNEGTMTINNWLWNGDRSYSGFRDVGSPYYTKYSMHSFGKAIDAVFSKYSAEHVRAYILKYPEKFPYITGIEMDISWLHIDCRNSFDLIKFGK